MIGRFGLMGWPMDDIKLDPTKLFKYMDRRKKEEEAEKRLLKRDLKLIQECPTCGADGPLEAIIALPETIHCLRPVYWCEDCGNTFLAVHFATWIRAMFSRNIQEVVGDADEA